jgi:hypothetical protein
MSSPIVVPFNFQPVSTTLRTSNYTIPSGRYAYAIPNAASCSINGSIFVCGTSSLTVAGTNAVMYPITGYSGDIRVFSNASNATKRLVTFQTVSATTSTVLDLLQATSTNVLEFYLMDGVISSIVSGTRATGNYDPSRAGEGSPILGLNASASTTYTIQKIRTSPLWVSSGDVLSGNGTFLWSVMEYNKIS